MIQLDINHDDMDSIVTLCTSMQFALLSLSLDMHITQVNSVAEVLFLKTRDQLLNKPFHEICLTLGIELSLSNISSESLKKFIAPTTHLLPDGKTAEVHWMLSRYMREFECVGYALVGKILATYAKPEYIQVSQVSSIPCAVFSKDITGQFLSVNDYFTQISGFSNAAEIIGKNDFDTPWCETAEKMRQGDALVIAEQSTIVLEEEFSLADGNKALMLTTKSPLRDKHGKIIGVVGTTVNTSQNKRTLLCDTPLNRFICVNKDSTELYLTKKEIECINWMVKGKSASEIAMILSTSPRTVEAHMNNIKRKLNCYKQFQLGYLIGKYGYLFL